MSEEGAPSPLEQAPGSAERSCTACGSGIPKAGYFCPNCGTPVPGGAPPYAHYPKTWTGHPVVYESTRTPTRAVLKAIASVIILSFVIVLILELVALVAGIPMVGPDILDLGWSWPLFVIVPVIVEFVRLSGYALLGYYLFLVGAIVLSVSWVLVTSIKGFRAELEMKARPKEHSALFDAGALMFATIFFSLVAALLLGGTSPVSSEDSLQKLLLILASASVWEELVSRALLIGVPLLVFHIVIRKRQSVHRYLLGGGFKLGPPETVLVVVSAIMFGVAHYEGGWGVWKILPAAVGGLAFGYLFLKHGIAAAIVVHFGTDYLTMPSEVFNSPALLGVMGITELIWAGAGAVFFAYFLIRALEFLSGTEILKSSPRPQAVASGGQMTQSPPRYPAPVAPHAGSSNPGQPEPSSERRVSYGTPVGHGFGGGYTCPVCGNREARWIEGKFQCLRCGHLS